MNSAWSIFFCRGWVLDFCCFSQSAMIFQSLNLTNFFNFPVVLVYLFIGRAIIMLLFHLFYPISNARTGQFHLLFFWLFVFFCCKEEDSVFSCISNVFIMFWKGKPPNLFASALFSFILKPNKRHIHMSVSIHPCDPVLRFSLGHWHRVVMTSPCIKTAVCLGLCAK